LEVLAVLEALEVLEVLAGWEALVVSAVSEGPARFRVR
jgi:hypothetical protein